MVAVILFRFYFIIIVAFEFKIWIFEALNEKQQTKRHSVILKLIK